MTENTTTIFIQLLKESADRLRKQADATDEIVKQMESLLAESPLSDDAVGQRLENPT